MTLNPDAEKTQLLAPDITIDQSLAHMSPEMGHITQSQLSTSEGKPQDLDDVSPVAVKESPTSEVEMITAADTFMSDLEMQTGLLVNLPWMEILQREERLVEELQETRLEVDRVRTKYQEEIKRQEQTFITAQLEIQSLQHENQRLVESEIQLNTESQNLQEELKLDQEKLSSLEMKYNVLSEKFDGLSSENKQLSEEIASLREQKEEWENEKHAMIAVIQTPSETTNNLELQIEELSAKLLIKESDHSDLEAKIESLQDLHAEQLAKTQAMLDSEIEAGLVLRQEKSKLELKIAELVSRSLELEQSLAAQKHELKQKAQPVIPPHVQRHYEDMERKYIQAKKYTQVDIEILETP